MSLRVDYSVLNQRETPSLFADVFSNRPAFGFNGRLFISIDTKQIYRDYGTNWELIADAGAGSGNLQSVCTNGNFTTTDIDMLSGNLILRSLTPGGVLFTNASEIVTQDVTNFFWDDTNNRLGIGTNTPTAPLDVHSTGNILQQLNGTSTNNTYLAFLNQDIGKWRIGNYYNSGDNDFVIYDTFSGVTRAFFTNTGYTILPTNIIIGSSNRSSAYGMDVYVSANYQSTLRVQGATTLLSQINGTFAVFSGDLTIATNKFFVNSSTGNIGMGTITPEANSNNTTLQIDGTNSSFVRTGTSAYGGYFATIPTADVLVLSNVRNPVTGTFSNINKACSQMSLWGESGNGYITFSTSPTNNGAPVERMRIASGGDVTFNSGAALFFGSASDTYLTGSSSLMAFAVNNAERMRILSTGAVCIGTTTAIVGANSVLQVNGTDAGPTFKNGNSAQQGLEMWSAVSTGDNLFIEFSTNTSITVRGSIDYNRAAGLLRYNTISDANLKNIIGNSNLEKSIDILNSTKIREFSWKEDETNKPQIGVIAQELYETYKGAVSKGSDDELFGSENYKTWEVDKTAFTYHLIAGWQKHNQIIKELEARIKQLENK